MMSHHKLLQAIGLLVLLLGSLCLLNANFGDFELRRTLAWGRLIWLAGALPPGAGPEWLAGALLHPLYAAGGLLGLHLFKYGLGLATLGCLFLAGRARGAAYSHALFGVASISLFLLPTVASLGPQAFTILGCALTLLLLERYRADRNPGRLGLLAPGLALWANLHAGFPAGVLLIGLYALGEAWDGRPAGWLWATLGLAAAATLANPYGPAAWYSLATETTPARVLRLYLVIFGVCHFLALPWLLRWRRWQDRALTLALPVCLGAGWLLPDLRVLPPVLLGVCLPALAPIYRAVPAVHRAFDWLGRFPRHLVGAGGVAAVAILLVFFLSSQPFRFAAPANPQDGNPPSHHIYPLDFSNFDLQNG